MILVAAATLPVAIGGRHIVGSPVAQYVPGPPAAGDCLARLPAASKSEDTYPALPAEPCGGARAGEVVTSFTDRRAPVVAMHNSDPNQEACASAVDGYLGHTLGPSGPDWELPTTLTSFIEQPSALQIAAGQRWVACVLVLIGPDQDPVPWTGTARNALAPGSTPPTAFATCLKMSSLINYQRIACAQPHTAEAFGLMSTAHIGLTQVRLDTTCAVQVRDRTGMTDPTAGGLLSIRAVAVHGADGPPIPGLGAATDDSGFALCELVAATGRALHGPLLGLGAGAVPLDK